MSQFGSVSLRIVIPIAPLDSAAFGAFRPVALPCPAGRRCPL